MTTTRRRTLAWLAAAASCAPLARTPALAADPLNDGTFRDEVLSLLRAKRPELAAAPHASDKAMIKIGNTDIALDNIYRLVRDMSGAEREKALLNLTTSLDDGDRRPLAEVPFAEIAPRLRLSLVASDYVNVVRDELGKSLLHWPLSPYVVVACAIDSPATIAYATREDAAAWKQTDDAMRQQALAGLDKITRATELVAKAPRSGAGHFVAAASRDGYMAAHCLAPNVQKTLADRLGAKVFVGIPNRDFLVAWSADYAPRARFAAQIAKDFGRQPHPLSPELFVLDGAQFRLANAAELADHGRP